MWAHPRRIEHEAIMAQSSRKCRRCMTTVALPRTPFYRLQVEIRLTSTLYLHTLLMTHTGDILSTPTSRSISPGWDPLCFSKHRTCRSTSRLAPCTACQRSSSGWGALWCKAGLLSSLPEGTLFALVYTTHIWTSGAPLRVWYEGIILRRGT